MQGSKSTSDDRGKAIAQVRAALTELACDVALLTHPPVVRWSTGFSGSDGLVAIRADTVHFVSDGRYVEQARQQVAAGIIRHTVQGELIDALVEGDFFSAGDRVLVQGNHTTVAQLQTWQERLPASTWSAVKGWLDEPMAYKSEREVEAIRSITRGCDRARHRC